MNSRLSAALLTTSTTVALSLLPVAPAAALTVTVGSYVYDVSVYTGSYNSNPTLFQGPPAGQMPWWGDGTGDLASIFAHQVYDRLGSGPTFGYGPVFAYKLSGSDILGIVQNLSDPLSQIEETVATDASVNYATATPLGPATSPVPGPLPLLGVAAAFRGSRKLKTRIHRTQQPQATM